MMIELDGSFGEGGGSMLRQALAFSMLFKKDFRIVNIRKGRPTPGLSAQHVAALDASAVICDAEVNGNFLGSTDVCFKPGVFKGGNHKVDIGTAGSITLLLQAFILPSLFCGKRVSFTLTGGTDVSWSSPYDYFRSVFLPQLKRFGDLETGLFRRGYFPKGNGEIRLSVNGKYGLNDELPSIEITNQRHLLYVRGVSHASFDLESGRVSERQAESARLFLKTKGLGAGIITEYSNAFSTGSGLTLWAVFGDQDLDYFHPVILGASSLGAKDKKSEAVGLEAAAQLVGLISSGCPVDEHLLDQLVPFMALSGGKCKASRISKHALSNIYVAQKFTDSKFLVEGDVVSCIRNGL